MRAVPNSTKIIEISEYQCEPTTMTVEEFITAQTLDGFGNPLTPEELLTSDEELHLLNNLNIGQSMEFGEPEAGLTIKRVF